jgi:hypothetical protein
MSLRSGKPPEEHFLFRQPADGIKTKRRNAALHLPQSLQPYKISSTIENLFKLVSWYLLSVAISFNLLIRGSFGLPINSAL